MKFDNNEKLKQNCRIFASILRIHEWRRKYDHPMHQRDATDKPIILAKHGEIMQIKWRGLSFRESCWLFGPWLLGALAVIVLVAYYWQPAPPKSIVMATGPEGGAAHRAGERYRAVLEKRGVKVALRNTSGSVENRAKLLDDSAGIVAAFVQTGVATAEDGEWLSTIAGVYPEPLWVFYRAPKPVMQASELLGKKMAIGDRGSGTRRMALDVFSAYGVDLEAQPHVDYTGRNAAALMRTGELDAIVLVTGEDSELVQTLLREPGIRLLEFPQSVALSRRFPQLNTVVLSPGIIDLAQNIPSRDIPLIAAMSQLMIRSDLHPALIRVLAEAAKEIHGGSGWFHKSGEFPKLSGTDLPVEPDAERFFVSGTPFLQRHLPFWVAFWVERLVIILIPLLAIGIPAIRFIPVIYNWRMRARIYRWYAEVRRLDSEVSHKPPAAEAVPDVLAKLNRIEAQADKIHVPLAFARELYDLKLHIEFVRRRLEAI